MVIMQPAPPPRSSPLKWIVIGCVGFMVLGGVGIGGCLVAIVKATAAPVKAGEEFLQAMSAGDAAKARGLAEAGVPVDALLQDAGVWGTGWSVSNRSINVNNGVATGAVSVTLPGKDGKTRKVDLTLVDHGGWKVTSVAVDGRPFGSTAEVSPPTGPAEFRAIDVKKSKTDEGWKVVITFEVHGLRSEARGANRRIAATEGVSVTGPDGAEIVRNDNLKTLDTEGTGTLVATFTNTFTLEEPKAKGKFVLHATVRDHLGGATVTKDIEFTLP